MMTAWFLTDEGQPLPHDTRVLAARVLDLSGKRAAAFPEWERAVACGFVKDRCEYIQILHSTGIYLSGIRLEEEMREASPELILMVKMLDQIDSAVNLLTERAVEWYRSLHPEFSRKSFDFSGKKMRDLMKDGSEEAFYEILVEIDHLAGRRSSLARRVSLKANQVLPNCSALAGGLVAARLVAEAGGIRTLSRLPGSAIQVLGARNALFSHLTGGSPPPKHGLIYQYSGIHGSAKERRGRIARVLAAKLAIAARIDQYRGEADPEFIAKAKEAIRCAGRIP